MRREPRPVGNKPMTSIPPGDTWTRIIAAPPTLFRPDWPWRQHFPGRDAWLSIARRIEIDGVAMAAHFVATDAEANLLLWRGGWKDVTATWRAEQLAAETPTEEVVAEPVAAVAEPVAEEVGVDGWTWTKILGLEWNELRRVVKSLGAQAPGTRHDLNHRLAGLVGVTPQAA